MNVSCVSPSHTGTYVSATAKMCEADVTDITEGCMGEAGASSVGLTPRYAQQAMADARYVYLYGGSDFTTADNGFGTVFRFEHASCRWDLIVADTSVPRTEMAIGAFGTGLYSVGGVQPDGSFTSNVAYLPLQKEA